MCKDDGGKLNSLDEETAVISDGTNLSGEVLEDGGAVDGGGGADASMRRGPVLEVAVDPAHGELQPSAGGPRDGLGLRLARVLSCLASGHFWLVKCGLDERRTAGYNFGQF